MNGQLELNVPDVVLSDLDVDQADRAAAAKLAAEIATSPFASACRCWPHNIPNGDRCLLCGRALFEAIS